MFNRLKNNFKKFKNMLEDKKYNSSNQNKKMNKSKNMKKDH